MVGAPGDPVQWSEPQDGPASQPPILIFDGDCGFCTVCVGWLRRRLVADVVVTAWQDADLAALGVTEQRARYEVVWVGPSARRGVAAGQPGISGGACAIADALGHCRAPGWRLAGRALSSPPLRWIAPPGYRLIARNRHRLPGGTAACAAS